MATASRQVSLSSNSSNHDFSLSSAPEQATVEECPSDVEVLSILREAAVSGSRPLESILDAVADAARVLSGADGTALGLDTNGTIVCRARSGNMAPPIGAPISAESGISGECLRTGAMLVCHDAMTDPRVDGEVCRSLGIRSIAVVPLRGPKRLAGLLEAFAARPNAFDSNGLTALRDLAEIAETAYVREVSNLTPALKPPTPPARPVPERPRPATHLAQEPVAGEILDEASQPNKKRVIWAVGIAVGLLLTVSVAWWAWHTPADETPSGSTTQKVQAASPEPASSTPALSLIPKPAPGVGTTHGDRVRAAGIVQNAADVKPIDLRSEAGGTPDTVEVRIPKQHSTEDSPAPEAPTVSLAPSTSPDTLAGLTTESTPMPTAAPRISQGVVEATLIKRVEPVYPVQARNQRLQGKVTLSATIASDGSVRQVAVVNGSPVLAEAAKTAVLKWRYRPATLNGSHIEVQKDIIVLFAQP